MPAYVPDYQDVFESIVVDNVLAFTARDYKACLDALYPVVAAGTSLLDDSIARAVGLKVLHVDGFTTKPGEGDLFTIAGDTQVYEVVSATALVGTDSDVTFRPGLKVAIPAVDGNEVVTFSGLPDFSQKTFGDFMRLSTPTLSAQPGGGSSSDEGSYESGQLKILLELAVEDPDPAYAARKCVKYARAMRVVLQKASVADYTAGSSIVIMSLVKLLSWKYSEVAKNADTGMWLKGVKFELTLKYNER